MLNNEMFGLSSELGSTFTDRSINTGCELSAIYDIKFLKYALLLRPPISSLTNFDLPNLKYLRMIYTHREDTIQNKN